MTHGILLVDAQREILRLLRSSLETLRQTDLEVHEALSGEEALLAATNHKIDLLVVDTQLHGFDGLELVHKIRAGHPDVSVILIADHTERRAHAQLADVGATAIFGKPVPLGDYLDAVERALGLTRTIFQPVEAAVGERRHARVSDLLANFRQDTGALAVVLLDERGEVLARAGVLESSVEGSLLPALADIHAAASRILKMLRSEPAEAYHVVRGSEYDLLFFTITPLHALVVAGRNLADQDRIPESWRAMRGVRVEVEKALGSIGVTGELPAQPQVTAAQAGPASEDHSGEADAHDMLDLLDAAQATARPDDVDSFWEQAARQHAGTPMNPSVISFEQARKMGLTPEMDDK
jgi:CheY-like chemotaxis protein